MEDNLILQLKKLRAVGPDTAWNANARRVVLASRITSASAPVTMERPRVFSRTFWFVAPAIAVLAIVLVVLPPLFADHSSPVALTNSALNPANIQEELNGLSINIQIKEIRYQETAQKAVASAISEITDTETPHLSPSLLQNELPPLELKSPRNLSIDSLLDNLTQ